MADATLKTLQPVLKEHDISLSSGGQVKAYSYDHGRSEPVLLMVHGYPQGSFMWRHVVPLLQDKISMFIPELPGYGISSLPPKPDKRTVGTLLIEALHQVFGKERSIIWCGHDRGARIGHRIIVDDDPKFNLKGAILMDIVPTLVQFRAFVNPSAAVAYFHWSFLAIPEAPHMIELLGGQELCHNVFGRTKGNNETGTARFKENHSWEVYGHQFNNPECIAGSCADYKSAAETEWKEQEDDQSAGRKIKIPTMVLYSAAKLGAMHDVPNGWKDWAEGDLKVQEIGEGFGHYLPEECPDHVAKFVAEWIDRIKA